MTTTEGKETKAKHQRALEGKKKGTARFAQQPGKNRDVGRKVRHRDRAKGNSVRVSRKQTGREERGELYCIDGRRL